MIRLEDKDDTLAALRELPPEVGLDQVAGMVAVFPLTPEPTNWLQNWSNHLNLLIMSASTLLLGLGLYLFTGQTPRTPTPPPAPSVEMTAPVGDTTPSVAPPALLAPPPLAQVPVPAKPAAPSAPAVPLPPLEPPPLLPYDPSLAPVEVADDQLPAPIPAAATTPGARQYPVKDYRKVEVLGNLNIIVEAGDFEVTAQGDDEVLERLSVKVDGERLLLYVQDKSETRTKKGLFGGTVTTTTSGSCGGDKLAITVRLPQLERAQVQGSGSIRIGDLQLAKGLDLRVQGSGGIKAEGAITTSDLTVSVQGSGKVECARITVAGHTDITVQGSGHAECRQVGSSARTSVSVQGSGRALVSGATEELLVSLKGSGQVQAQDLSARKSTVDLAGSGNVHVKESANLTVQSAGSGRVRTGN